jgi:hypothetical protein
MSPYYHGRLITHEFRPMPSSLVGKHYAVDHEFEQTCTRRIEVRSSSLLTRKTLRAHVRNSIRQRHTRVS